MVPDLLFHFKAKESAGKGADLAFLVPGTKAQQGLESNLCEARACPALLRTGRRPPQGDPLELPSHPAERPPRSTEDLRAPARGTAWVKMAMSDTERVLPMYWPLLSTSDILTDFILITTPFLSTCEMSKLGYRHSQWPVGGGAASGPDSLTSDPMLPTLPFRFSERNRLTFHSPVEFGVMRC